MPNHVTSILRFDGDSDQINKLLDEIRGEEENQFIDFNKIVPMSDDLQIEASMGPQNAAEWALRDFPTPPKEKLDVEEAMEKRDYKKLADMMHFDSLMKGDSPLELDDEEWELFLKMMNNKRKHGAYTWYGWANDFWGTKWNAYDQAMVDETAISFQTAWCIPHKVLEKLSQMYPDVLMRIDFADEDLGSNCGWFTFKNDEIVESCLPEYGDESCEFAAQLLYNQSYVDLQAEWAEDEAEYARAQEEQEEREDDGVLL